MFASGFLGIAVADTLYLRALNVMGASRTGIVSALYTPFVILLSAVFLDEMLSPWQWLGFALSIVWVYAHGILLGRRDAVRQSEFAGNVALAEAQ